MNDGARRAAVGALIELAGSQDFRDRADAGQGLAGFTEAADARRTLVDLVLDAEDTFVSRTTAEALLRRRDAAGLALVASALAVADDSHADWIHTAVRDVFMVFGRDRDAAVRECEAMTRSPEGHVHIGAIRLIGMLAEIDPILLPTQDG